MKFPYLRFVKKFCFSKICEKMMFKIPICRNLNFCFQKMQFLDTTEIINTFFEIDIMHGEKRNFFGIFSFIFTMVDKSKFHFFQPFLPQFRVTPPPPIVLLRKRKKVSNFYLLVFRQKLENPSLHGENDFFKIFEKNVHMGILTKISKNSLDVQGLSICRTCEFMDYWIIIQIIQYMNPIIQESITQS